MGMLLSQQKCEYGIMGTIHPLYGVGCAATTGSDDVIDHVTDADIGTLARDEVW